jgi:hypothetical protein
MRTRQLPITLQIMQQRRIPPHIHEPTHQPRCNFLHLGHQNLPSAAMSSRANTMIVTRAGSASVCFQKRVAELVQYRSEAVAPTCVKVFHVAVVSVKSRMEQNLRADDGIEGAYPKTSLFAVRTLLRSLIICSDCALDIVARMSRPVRLGFQDRIRLCSCNTGVLFSPTKLCMYVLSSHAVWCRTRRMDSYSPYIRKFSLGIRYLSDIRRLQNLVGSSKSCSWYRIAPCELLTPS